MACSDLEQQSDKGLYQDGFRVVADSTFLHSLRGGNLKKSTVIMINYEKKIYDSIIGTLYCEVTLMS